MPFDSPTELVCEIDTIDPRIRGRIRDRTGRSREFCGWTELGSALVALAESPDLPRPTPEEEP